MDNVIPVNSTTKYLLDWQTLLKAIIVMTIMVCTIQLDLEQSTIITIIVALMIKAPDPSIGKDYGLRRLLTTYASVLYAIPP